ncbi:DUF4197 domain-containing protein [Panacibacter ginsenosidivorans]|uniref:DUF4197 domain-containing protein n=1 Tax=Panacibacter ginsenosidivorans TaxID=1813871 RepID=A0A5B8V7V0_9BACT|nr:DUF4197 domain-containing protein [Panacibacter ginsenosidivorans]QEC67245.1 DUF4197 domain-containing protein [Panacibacter ginsenosidivorans]
MKKLLCAFLIFPFFSSCDVAQQVLNDSTSTTGALSTTDIVAGLKEALTVGTQNSSNKLSAVDGFFKDAAIKILMPPEAQKVESTLRSLGFGSVVDKAILSMNRGAEDAAKSATPIFVNAIKQMTITDALGILKGGDNAATNYFKDKTTAQLTSAFRPVIDKALVKTDATKYWGDVFSVYNKFSAKKVDTDLGAYVTGKAIDGIFYEVALEEQKIRKDPAARVTDILKKVFGSKEAQTN